jgi:hypothetical protein
MKSFLDGKKTMALTPLAPATGPAPRLAANGKNGHTHDVSANGSKAHVEIVKEGDKVVRIFVTCNCGERLEIECLYPASS